MTVPCFLCLRFCLESDELITGPSDVPVHKPPVFTFPLTAAEVVLGPAHVSVGAVGTHTSWFVSKDRRAEGWAQAVPAAPSLSLSIILTLRRTLARPRLPGPLSFVSFLAFTMICTGVFIC